MWTGAFFLQAFLFCEPSLFVVTSHIGAIQVSMFFGSAVDAHVGFIKKQKEKRKSSRRAVGTRAWIRVNGAFQVLTCRVHDISNGGVQITVDKAGSIPKEFILLLRRGENSGRRARIKWQRGLIIGAEFL